MGGLSQCYASTTDYQLRWVWNLTRFSSSRKNATAHGLLSRFAKQMKVSTSSMFSRRTAAMNDIPWTWNPTAKALSSYDLVKNKFNRWWTVVSGTRKYDDPRLNMSHEGEARVWHVQPSVVLFPCPTNDCASYVLSSDQLQESWIICKLKSFSPLYLHDLNTQARRVIFGVSKTLCDFGHKNSFKEE